MFKHTKLCSGLLLAFGGLAIAPGSVMAQDATSLQRVEVTGSAIKRLDSETTVPITILKADDLKKIGIETIEQILNMVAGNQTTQGSNQAVGAATGGASFANLRGLGQNKTLVLLNGRRVANNAIDGAAPDLNMIPIAALDRIEVLRDGASSLYGTDAIGGVINFITKKDFTGVTITAGVQVPTLAGGKSNNVNIGFGTGDLTKDGFNFMGFFDHQEQDNVSASQRSFASTGYRPELGIKKSSGNAYPANYFQLSADGSTSSPGANPSAPGCDAQFSFYLKGGKCRYDYTGWVDLVPPTIRNTAVLKGSFALNANTEINVEYLWGKSINRTSIAPVPYGALTMNPGTPFFPGNGITPAPRNFTIDPTLPISLQWRAVPTGARTDFSDNTQQRLVTSIEGNVEGWDYSVGLAFNRNDVIYNLTGGYADGTMIQNGVATGIINPFGNQTAAGQAYLNSALTPGNLTNGKAETKILDAHASRELGDWMGAGRNVGLAVGTEFRTERASYVANAAFAQQVVSSTGTDPATNQVGDRTVAAVYTELNIPLAKTFDLTAAVRYDRYNDFGNTTNPKLSFKYTPTSSVLLRGAVSTGFRAPSLYEINNPQTYGNTANAWDDPVKCIDGNPVPGALPTACGSQFMSLSGGNKQLNPEKSKNLTFGLVMEPVKDFTVGIDLWWIRLTDSIGTLSDTTIFSSPAKYAYLFKRAPDGSLATDGSQCPGANCGYVLNTTMNLGGNNTNGVDLTMAYLLRTSGAGTFNFTLNGTYVDKYEYQNEPEGEWNQNVGIYSGTGPVFKWQTTLNAQWKYGDYGLGLTNRFKSGYVDQNDPAQVAACCINNYVGSYSVWDINGSWTPTKSLTVIAGVRNVFNTVPPFSNQGATFQVGYDPRFADPVGRAGYVRGTYNF